MVSAERPRACEPGGSFTARAGATFDLSDPPELIIRFLELFVEVVDCRVRSPTPTTRDEPRAPCAC